MAGTPHRRCRHGAPCGFATVRRAVANIKQQKKRILVAKRQRLENLRYRSQIKTYFRRLAESVNGGDADKVDERAHARSCA